MIMNGELVSKEEEIAKMQTIERRQFAGHSLILVSVLYSF
jgi:hypothetical protein